MASHINLVLYLLGGEAKSGKTKLGFLGGHGYSYDIETIGKKKIQKDVPTTTGYYVSGSNQNVVVPIDVMSLMITRQPGFFSALMTGMITLFNYVLNNEEIKNVAIVSKYKILDLALKTSKDDIIAKGNKLGRAELTNDDLVLVEEYQRLYGLLTPRSKVFFDNELSVEGGLGMKSANEQSSLAEITTTWDTTQESLLTFTPQKQYWDPENDFNRIISGQRWYFKTSENNHYYDDFAGFRRYDFGKLDDKKYYGKITPDVTYGSLFTKTPILLLDKLYEFTKAKTKNPKGLLVAGDLKYVKSKTVKRMVNSYPGTVIDNNVVIPFTVSGTDNPTLIEIIDPPGLSYRITDTFDDLTMIFNAFSKRDENNRFGDRQSFIEITDQVYKKEVNGKGVTKVKLADTFRQSTLNFKLNVSHSKAIKPVPIQLGVSFDTPPRDALGSVSEPEVRVWVNVEESDEKCLRYRTLIVTNDWIYVHTAGNANVRVLNLAELGLDE